MAFVEERLTVKAKYAKVRYIYLMYIDYLSSDHFVTTDFLLNMLFFSVYIICMKLEVS